MFRGTSRRRAAAMNRASLSCGSPVDDMKKRSRRRALPQALLGHAGPGSIPAIDQAIPMRGDRAGIMVFMAEHFRACRAERTVLLKPRAAIAQMQLAPGEGCFEPEQPGHLVSCALGVLDPAPQHHVAPALAVDRHRTFGQGAKPCTKNIG